jgi:hypothetical protein
MTRTRKCRTTGSTRRATTAGTAARRLARRPAPTPRV